MTKLKPYNGPGIIKQLPACKKSYRGKTIFGGRKIPTSYIGAAGRWRRKAPWERGIINNSDVSVRFTIADGQIRMRWNEYK